MHFVTGLSQKSFYLYCIYHINVSAFYFLDFPKKALLLFFYMELFFSLFPNVTPMHIDHFWDLNMQEKTPLSSPASMPVCVCVIAGVNYN